MRKTVRKLARCFPTAIVTGRCIDKVHFHSFKFLFYKKKKINLILILILFSGNNFQVYNFIRLAELYYAGSHGMDIKGPTKESKSNEVNKL